MGKKGVRTSSFGLLAGVLGGGGLAAVATPEKMADFTSFAAAIPLGAYIVMGLYIVYRMEIEKARIYMGEGLEEIPQPKTRGGL